MRPTHWRFARQAALWLLPVILGAGLLVGCGDDASADEPPEIEYGKTECDRCHMIISDARFAAGLVAEDGEPIVFDDIGEMIAVVQEEGLNGRRAWVHDYDSKEWIDATGAIYVVSTEVVTPMGSGVSAFAARDAAETFAGMNAGQVMTWDEMLGEWTMPMRHP